MLLVFLPGEYYAWNISEGVWKFSRETVTEKEGNELERKDWSAQ